LQKHFIRNVVERLTEHDDVTAPLLRRAPHLGLALGFALARASPEYRSSRAVKDLLVVNNSYENTDVMNSNFILGKSDSYRSILENCSDRGGLDDIGLASVSNAFVRVFVHASIQSSI